MKKELVIDDNCHKCPMISSTLDDRKYCRLGNFYLDDKKYYDEDIKDKSFPSNCSLDTKEVEDASDLGSR